MKIINPNVEYIPQSDNTLNGIFKQIEKAGRTCYKSEDKITEDSAEAFVQHMIYSDHTAMLEHGTVYLTMRTDINEGSELYRAPWYKNNELVKQREIFGYVQTLFMFNPYSIVNLHTDHDTNETTMCITTNYRVIVENGWEDIMKQLISEPTQWHTPRITLKFTTNIGVTREGNRMRANSIAEESTRYCDYTKEKHGNGETNIVPPIWFEPVDDVVLKERTKIDWLETIYNIITNEMDDVHSPFTGVDYYGAAIVFTNICYNNLRRLDWKPQQAREVLTLATKSDVVYTAFPHQWRHFFDLRLFGKTGTPHPNMKAIASLARDILCEKDLWYLVYRPSEPEFSAHQVEGDATTKQD